MKRTMLLVRFFAVLSLAIWMLGAASVQTMAQDGNTTDQSADATPDDSGNGTAGNQTGDDTSGGPTEEPATGTLTVQVFSCSTGGDAGTSAVFAEGEFTPDESCAEGDATIVIDGGDATDVSGSADFTLDAGVHTVADATTGAALDVEVVADAGTTVSVVGYVAPEEEAVDDDVTTAEEGDADAAAVSTKIHLVKHDCVPDIQSVDTFNVLTADERLVVCPAISRLADATEEENVVKGEPADFDFDFETDDIDNDEPVTLSADGTYILDTDRACEPDLDLPDVAPGTNLCFDNSGYDVTVGEGSITITESVIPVKHRFGTVELPDAEDALALVTDSVDAESGQFTLNPALDTSADGELVVDVYNFSPPRVSVIVHNCSADIGDLGDFDDLDSFDDQLLACPAVTLDGDTGPDNVATDGTSDFDLTVTDDDKIQIMDDARFIDEMTCELDLGVDLDEGDAENLCLPGYAFDDVLQGDSVKVAEISPTDYEFGAALVNPNGLDADPLNVDETNATVTLDTTEDGNVTVHIFNFRLPDEGGGDPEGNNTGNNTGGNNTGGNTTGGNTSGGNNTGGSSTGGGDTGGDGSNEGGNTGSTGSGWVRIYQLYCLTDSEYVEVLAGVPGESIDPYSYGDDSCIPDGNEVQITDFEGTDMPAFSIDYVGVSEDVELPANDGQGPYLLTDTFSGTYGEFDIEPGKTTDVVVLVWELDGGYDEEYYGDGAYDEEDQYAADEAAVESGADLPDTGTGATSNANTTLIALLGLGGLMLLGGAYRVQWGKRG